MPPPFDLGRKRIFALFLTLAICMLWYSFLHIPNNNNINDVDDADAMRRAIAAASTKTGKYYDSTWPSRTSRVQASATPIFAGYDDDGGDEDVSAQDPLLMCCSTTHFRDCIQCTE